MIIEHKSDLIAARMGCYARHTEERIEQEVVTTGVRSAGKLAGLATQEAKPGAV